MLCVYDLLTVRGDTRDKIKKNSSPGTFAAQLELCLWGAALTNHTDPDSKPG